ncbi:MAG: HTTM domain-containing protein [Thermodesulfobacteriota bacterium]
MSRATIARGPLAPRLLQRWRELWFPAAPLSDLAIARVVLVVIVLYLNGNLRFSSVARAPAVAWEPIALVELLGLGQPSIEEMRSLQIATRALLLAGGVGLLTNVALLGAFVLQLVQEAFLNCFGKVTHSTVPLMHAMLFFALSPCGRVWSLDAALRRLWRGGHAEGARAAPQRSRFARWPFELLFVELSFYYFNGGLSKLARSGFAWAEGSTLQYYLLERGFPTGLWVAASPALCSALSWGALLFELVFPIAIVVRRLRLPFLAVGLLFHVGNHVLLDLSFWPVPAIYLLVVPWSELRRLSLARDAEPAGGYSSVPASRAISAGGKPGM